MLLRNLRNKARKGGKLEWAWSGPYTISKVLPKGLYEFRNEDGTELKTSFNSLRLKIYHHPVQSHPTINTSAEMPLKFGADKEDKNNLTELTKVDLLEKDRNIILSNCSLDENVINESQNILEKQFPNIGDWQDTLLCQTPFSAFLWDFLATHFISMVGKKVVEALWLWCHSHLLRKDLNLLRTTTLELTALEITRDTRTMVIIRVYCVPRNLCGDHQLLLENELSQVCNWATWTD